MDRLTTEMLDPYAKEKHFTLKGCPDQCARNCFGCKVLMQAIDRLAAYEETGLDPEEVDHVKLALMGKAIAEIKEFDGVPIDHLRDLLQAEKDGLVRILPKGEDGTCGGCGHFKRIPGKRCGTCEVRPNYTDRRGSIEVHRGTFTPSQSRKCCKQYIPHEEAEAAIAEKGGRDE